MVQSRKEVELIELDKPDSASFGNLPPGVVIERMGNTKQVTKGPATKTPADTTAKSTKGPGRPRKPGTGNVGVQGPSIPSSNPTRPPPLGGNNKRIPPPTNTSTNLLQSTGRITRPPPGKNTKKLVPINVKKPSLARAG